MHHHVHVVLFSHKSCASGVSDFCDKTPHTMGTAVTVSVTVSVTAPPHTLTKTFMYVRGGWYWTGSKQPLVGRPDVRTVGKYWSSHSLRLWELQEWVLRRYWIWMAPEYMHACNSQGPVLYVLIHRHERFPTGLLCKSPIGCRSFAQ